MPLCFIYAITHRASRERYIGSSTQLGQRWATHRWQLNAGIHHCRHLQNAWRKYGAQEFSFSVIREVDTSDRKERALLELELIAERPCYNSRIASLGAHNFENNSETRARISNGIQLAMKSNPEYAEFLFTRGKAISAYMKSPKGRKTIGSHTKRRWRIPSERAKLSRGLINRWADPQARNRQSQKMKAARGTPEARRANSEAMKAAWADPSSGLRGRKTTRWSHPNSRKIQSEKLKAAWIIRRKRMSQSN